MSRLLRLAAVLAPALGLAALWGMSHQTYHQGTDWEVPIQGYDPRDFLRGHYVEFSYDWPGIEEFQGAPPAALCLQGEAPGLARVTVLPAGQACAHPVHADSNDVYAWNSLTRGRLYIGQERAAQLDQQLRNRDQLGIVTIRQREDGSFTPISIRFRPLTPEERAERDARDAEAQRSRSAPPPGIMQQ